MVMPVINILIAPSVNMSYSLISKPWFAKLQFKSLHIKDELYSDYYRDACSISKTDMIAFLRANSSYRLKDSLRKNKAKVLILVGAKEQRKMKISAKNLNQIIKDSSLEILQGYTHGDISLNHAEQFADKLLELIEEDCKSIGGLPEQW